jgi:hypothetical protein
MPSQYHNDVAIEDLGLVLEEGGPMLPSMTWSRERVTWSGRAGDLASPLASVGPRVLRFKASGKVSTATARNALVNRLLDLYAGGLVEVRDSATPDLAMRGEVRVFDTSIASPAFVNMDPTILVEIECSKASKHDVSSSSLVIGATPTMIPCGTLSHGGRLFLTGVSAGALSTSVSIIYRDLAGQIVGTMTLLPALASGEFAIIDFDTQEIVEVNTSNVQTNVEDWLTAGDFFQFSPKYGNRDANVWGTLEATAGAALLTFRRNWHG